MDELALVDWITRHSRSLGPLVKVGPGDDCAVLAGTGREDIHFTIDEVVEGTHFRLAGRGLGPRASGRDVGYKALAAAVSDLAAMGARPIAAVAAASLRKGMAGTFGRAIHLGLTAAARDSGCPLVGGNISETAGPIAVTVAAIGCAPEGSCFLRSAARVGDAVFVTGELGGSILGRHLHPVPRFAESRRLRELGGVHAMMDVSDGLALDLWRLARASRVGAAIDAARVPVSPDARRLARLTGKSALEHALSDGEDYELLFTASSAAAERIERLWDLPTRLSRLGEIVPRSKGLLIREGARLRRLEPAGYRHL